MSIVECKVKVQSRSHSNRWQAQINSSFQTAWHNLPHYSCSMYWSWLLVLKYNECLLAAFSLSQKVSWFKTSAPFSPDPLESIRSINYSTLRLFWKLWKRKGAQQKAKLHHLICPFNLLSLLAETKCEVMTQKWIFYIFVVCVLPVFVCIVVFFVLFCYYSGFVWSFPMRIFKELPCTFCSILSVITFFLSFSLQSVILYCMHYVLAQNTESLWSLCFLKKKKKKKSHHFQKACVFIHNIFQNKYLLFLLPFYLQRAIFTALSPPT